MTNVALSIRGLKSSTTLSPTIRSRSFENERVQGPGLLGLERHKRNRAETLRPQNVPKGFELVFSYMPFQLQVVLIRHCDLTICFSSQPKGGRSRAEPNWK